MSYKGLGLHGRAWRAQKRNRKSCIDAYPDGRQVLYLNTGFADKKEAASVARQWIAQVEAEFDRIEREKAQLRTTTINTPRFAVEVNAAVKLSVDPLGDKSRRTPSPRP
jgi:hypothetical protein